jgi:hypothetical protein
MSFVLRPNAGQMNTEICGCCGARLNGTYAYDNIGVNITVSDIKHTGESDEALYVSVPVDGVFINLKLRKPQEGDKCANEDEDREYDE